MTEMPAAIRTLFGGMSALIFERCDNGPAWTREPSLFLTQEISLPSRYAPITKISAVVTHTASGEDKLSDLPDYPDGFEMLEFDLCVGKKESNVSTYLCVSRERIDEGPITSIIVLSAEEEKDKEGKEGRDMRRQEPEGQRGEESRGERDGG